MFYIAEEDIDTVNTIVCRAVKLLSSGAKVVELDVDIGDQINPIEVTGYWFRDAMRINVKLKKGQGSQYEKGNI